MKYCIVGEMKKKVVIALGGTGGHIFPAREIAKELGEEVDILYMGIGLSKNPFFEKEGVGYIDLAGSSLFGNPFKTLRGIWQALHFFYKEKIDLVVGMGSYHSAPPLFAALLCKIPYVLIEQNLVPGRVVSLFAPFAKATLLSFAPLVKPLKGESLPVGWRLGREKEALSQKEALKHFGLEEGKTTLLIFGGSQGAKGLNNAMREIVPHLGEGFQVIHITGSEEEKGVGAVVMPFCKEMEKAWRACDFAICRAGAGALREMLLYQKGALLVPYPKAKDDHQLHNALFMQNVIGGGKVVLEEELTKESLFLALEKKEEMEKALSRYRQEGGETTMAAVLKRWV